MGTFIFAGLVMGVVATAALDLWAIALNRTFGFAKPNWAFGGRWFAHAAKGQFVHEDITRAPEIPNETAIGWIGHYAIGILFAFVTVLIGGEAWLKAPTLFLPMAVGLITVGCGWFIMQPGMGAGIAASKKPDANRIRMLNIAGHIVFGLALYGAARLIA